MDEIIVFVSVSQSTFLISVEIIKPTFNKGNYEFVYVSLSLFFSLCVHAQFLNK